MRKPIIAGNWKMYLTPDNAGELVKALAPEVKGTSGVEVLVCPAMPVVSSIKPLLDGTGILLGAQNLYPAKEGAFTGEASADMLTAIGCTHVVLGHSERREYFNETDEFINEKVKAALAGNLIPILCVGESLEQREADQAFDVIEAQITKGLDGISASDAATMVVAYEPIWAIGTGKTATPEIAQDVHAFIRKTLASLYDDATAQAIRIQYGGSVKPANVDELMAKEDIDGALVGGASLKADSFARIVNFKTI